MAQAVARPPIRDASSATPRDSKTLSDKLNGVEGRVNTNWAEFVEHRDEVEDVLAQLVSAQRRQDEATARCAAICDDLDAKVGRASELASEVCSQQLEYQETVDGRIQALQKAIRECITASREAASQDVQKAFVAVRRDLSRLRSSSVGPPTAAGQLSAGRGRAAGTQRRSVEGVDAAVFADMLLQHLGAEQPACAQQPSPAPGMSKPPVPMAPGTVSLKARAGEVSISLAQLESETVSEPLESPNASDIEQVSAEVAAAVAEMRDWQSSIQQRAVGEVEIALEAALDRARSMLTEEVDSRTCEFVEASSRMQRGFVSPHLPDVDAPLAGGDKAGAERSKSAISWSPVPATDPDSPGQDSHGLIGRPSLACQEAGAALQATESLTEQLEEQASQLHVFREDLTSTQQCVDNAGRAVSALGGELRHAMAQLEMLHSECAEVPRRDADLRRSLATEASAHAKALDARLEGEELRQQRHDEDVRAHMEAVHAAFARDLHTELSTEISVACHHGSAAESQHRGETGDAPARARTAVDDVTLETLRADLWAEVREAVTEAVDRHPGESLGGVARDARRDLEVLRDEIGRRLDEERRARQAARDATDGAKDKLFEELRSELAAATVANGEVRAAAEDAVRDAIYDVEIDLRNAVREGEESCMSALIVLREECTERTAEDMAICTDLLSSSSANQELHHQLLMTTEALREVGSELREAQLNSESQVSDCISQIRDGDARREELAGEFGELSRQSAAAEQQRAASLLTIKAELGALAGRITAQDLIQRAATSAASAPAPCLATHAALAPCQKSAADVPNIVPSPAVPLTQIALFEGAERQGAVSVERPRRGPSTAEVAERLHAEATERVRATASELQRRWRDGNGNAPVLGAGSGDASRRAGSTEPGSANAAPGRCQTGPAEAPILRARCASPLPSPPTGPGSGGAASPGVPVPLIAFGAGVLNGPAPTLAAWHSQTARTAQRSSSVPTVGFVAARGGSQAATVSNGAAVRQVSAARPGSAAGPVTPRDAWQRR